MVLKTQLMQKAGIVTEQLARDFIGMELGERLPTVEELSKRHSAARGTVQQAISNLKSHGAIHLEPHGHLGTTIVGINYSRLMEICGASNLVGVMPLPYSRRYEGLATGIYTTLNDNTGVSVSLAFMGGSNRRLQTLLDGRCNFAVMSYVTADHYQKDGCAIDISITMGSHTYVNAHTLIMRSDFAGIPKRIGVDSASFDQMSMTAQYFQNRTIELVPLNYSHIIDNIKNKTIDASVWSLEEAIINDPELRYEPITLGADKTDQNTQASVVTRRDDLTTASFLLRFLDIERVQSLQQDVLHNIILPNY